MRLSTALGDEADRLRRSEYVTPAAVRMMGDRVLRLIPDVALRNAAVAEMLAIVVVRAIALGRGLEIGERAELAAWIDHVARRLGQGADRRAA